MVSHGDAMACPTITREELVKQLQSEISLCDMRRLAYIQNSLFPENMQVANVSNDSAMITTIGGYFTSD